MIGWFKKLYENYRWAKYKKEFLRKKELDRKIKSSPMILSDMTYNSKGK